MGERGMIGFLDAGRNHFGSMWLIVLVLAGLTPGVWAAGDEGVVVLAHARKLFLDDHVVAAKENVVRTIHPAKKFAANPVLRGTEPWEEDFVLLYGSVLRDGDRFRMWYYSRHGVCYAESHDGIAWTKPELDIAEIEGRKTNLVIYKQAEIGDPNYIPYFYECFGVFKDPRDPDPNRRYKMGFLSIQRNYEGPRMDPFHPRQRRGLGVAASPDGIHWTLLDNWATEAICDGATHWMYDEPKGNYVLFGRTKDVPEDLKAAWYKDPWAKRHFWGRSVARCESPDFLKWNFTDPATAPVVMGGDIKDPVGTEVYSMNVFPYESVYIGLVQRFINQSQGTLLDAQLAVSHDSVRFARVGDRTPFIPCGPVTAWDRFNNSLATNPPIEVGDELRFYYAGRTYRHGPYEGEDSGPSAGYIGFASIQRDRFVSLGASFDGGTVTTVPMKMTGETLHVNAKAPFGTVLVEVLGEDGAVVARSKAITQDALDITVDWEEKPASLAERPVSLRFTLRNAQIFSFWNN